MKEGDKVSIIGEPVNGRIIRIEKQVLSISGFHVWYHVKLNDGLVETFLETELTLED
jgi:hypothetical protein